MNKCKILSAIFLLFLISFVPTTSANGNDVPNWDAIETVLNATVSDPNAYYLADVARDLLRELASVHQAYNQNEDKAAALVQLRPRISQAARIVEKLQTLAKSVEAVPAPLEKTASATVIDFSRLLEFTGKDQLLQIDANGPAVHTMLGRNFKSAYWSLEMQLVHLLTITSGLPVLVVFPAALDVQDANALCAPVLGNRSKNIVAAWQKNPAVVRKVILGVIDYLDRSILAEEVLPGDLHRSTLNGRLTLFALQLASSAPGLQHNERIDILTVVGGLIGAKGFSEASALLTERSSKPLIEAAQARLISEEGERLALPGEKLSFPKTRIEEMLRRQGGVIESIEVLSPKTWMAQYGEAVLR